MAHYLCNDKKQICLIFKDYEMEFYEVLEKRRTYRDFSGREVSDEALKRIISAAFKAPANDHLRQFERSWLQRWTNRAIKTKWRCLPMPCPSKKTSIQKSGYI